MHSSQGHATHHQASVHLVPTWGRKGSKSKGTGLQRLSDIDLRCICCISWWTDVMCLSGKSDAKLILSHELHRFEKLPMVSLTTDSSRSSTTPSQPTGLSMIRPSALRLAINHCSIVETNALHTALPILNPKFSIVISLSPVVVPSSEYMTTL